MSAARRLLVSVVAATVLAAPAAAHANSAPPKGVPAKATVALAGKRSPKAAAALACANTDVMPTAQNIELVRAALLCLHNQVRAQRSLPLLKDDGKLRNAAAGYASEMIDGAFFDHTSPSGETFVDRILGAGYAKRTDAWTLGENLAWGTGEQSTPANVMNAWLSSPGHRANIIKRAYKDIGIGVRLGVPSNAAVGATFTVEFGAKA